MDTDELREAIDRWVNAGVIDKSTGEAIAEFESTTPQEDSTGNLALVIAGMGALLVGAGILVVFATNWERLGSVGQTMILLLFPTVAAVLSRFLDRSGTHRAAIALWALAAGLLGPSLYLLTDIYFPATSTAAVFLGWGILAVPMGHAYGSRIVTALGLGVLLLAVVLSEAGQSGPFAAAAMGSLVILAGTLWQSRQPALIGTYRTMGIVPLIGLLIWLSTMEGNYSQIETEWPLLVGGIAAGGVAVMGLILGYRREQITKPTMLLGSIPLVATVGALTLVAIGDRLDSLVLAIGMQGCLLASLLGIAVLAIQFRSRWLVNLVAVGFLLQVLSLTATIAGGLSGALALIVAGVVLLVAAIGIERGRRQVFSRFETE